MRNGVKVAMAAGALLFAAAAPALATTVDVGGGTWSYDEGANTAWSNYKHPQNSHSSSVSIGGQIFGSGCTVKGQWSLASAAKNGASPAYYYNPKC
ncbi:lactococcin 972 family bacteriocin [Streptomyces sp. NPDC051639]|uniref:lactococcin 972 family bacteriocin n=1 Tax=Streptomyces sp. NPDC051639 TaxID=3155671 RepID=UPI003442914C